MVALSGDLIVAGRADGNWSLSYAGPKVHKQHSACGSPSKSLTSVSLTIQHV
jgi:hypothetical protein